MSQTFCQDSVAAQAAPPSNRASWSGLLQLSLVGIPVKAYPAVRTSESSHFHLLHADCGERIRYAKQCPVHGTVDTAAIVRGFTYAPNQHVVIEPAKLDALRPARDRALRLEHFLDPAEFDPAMLSGRSLHLMPDGAAAQRGYTILRETMLQRGRWAVGRVVLGGHRNVVALRPTATHLILHVLHFPEHVRACPPVPAPNESKTHVAEEERLAGMLIDAASGPIAWEQYRDETTQELRSLVEAKLANQPPPVDDDTATVLPLLEALKKSAAALTVPETPRRTTSRKRSKRTA